VININQVLECKVSKDKPWVVFSAECPYDSATCISQTFGSDSAQAILWAKAARQELAALEVFRVPERAGFGGRQAFTKGNDAFYAACQSVSSATLALATWDQPNMVTEHSLKAVIVGFPVIVLDSTCALFKRLPPPSATASGACRRRLQDVAPNAPRGRSVSPCVRSLWHTSAHSPQGGEHERVSITTKVCDEGVTTQPHAENGL